MTIDISHFRLWIFFNRKRKSFRKFNWSSNRIANEWRTNICFSFQHWNKQRYIKMWLNLIRVGKTWVQGQIFPLRRLFVVIVFLHPCWCSIHNWRRSLLFDQRFQRCVIIDETHVQMSSTLDILVRPVIFEFLHHSFFLDDWETSLRSTTSNLRSLRNVFHFHSTSFGKDSNWEKKHHPKGCRRVVRISFFSSSLIFSTLILVCLFESFEKTSFKWLLGFRINSSLDQIRNNDLFNSPSKSIRINTWRENHTRW